MTHGRTARTRSLFTATVLVAATVLVPVTLTVTAQVATADPSNDVTVQPVNARSVSNLVKSAPIDPAKKYTWLITEDDTGDPGQAIADCVPSAANANPLRDTAPADGIQSFCQWPSIRTTPGNVPVIASGDQSELNGTTSIQLPNGKYLISVLADGYALGGAHFTVPVDGAVKVPLQPYPLPLGVMKIQVFHDNAPVDATFEVDGESGSGMSGYEAHLSDVLGEVTTDWFGNPVCTNYEQVGGVTKLDADGSPIIDSAHPGGKCVSDSTGLITIPNLGSNRYGVTLSEPADKQAWVQTTTLEGTHDHDVWLMNGDTGNDSELIVGGEPVPWVQFGYVEPRTISSGSAHVTGQVLAGLAYVGGNGGVTIPGGTGTAGGKEGPPIDRPWISLSDLGNGDQNVYTGRGNADGTFDIANVPNGAYQLTAWDDNQDYILFSSNIQVSNGSNLDTGKTYLSGWTSRIYGTVFIDSNGNGKRDSGEDGLPGTALTLRERDNSLIDQMMNTATTSSRAGHEGEYSFTEAYPLTKWLILEHFNTRYEGTGITFQGENDPEPTTIRGNAVDVNVLPVLGLGSRVDWGVRPYQPSTNGGIVGTVTYDTTRNELDPAYSVTEDYQPGIPGVTLHLYPVKKDAEGNPVMEPGSLGSPAHEAADKAHELAAPYTSETWEAPKGCKPLQWDGSPLNLTALPDSGAQTVCVESPADGQLTMPADATDGAFGQTVNGNYGFTESDLNLYPVGDSDNPGYPDAAKLPDGFTCPPDNTTACAPGNHDLPLYAPLADFGYAPQPLTPDDYVVTVDMPKDSFGKDIYQPTSEQDVNVFDGDNYLPQDNFPFTGTAGTGSSGSQGAGSGVPEAPPSQGGGLGVYPCVGPDQSVHVTNSNFADGGGSPFEGQPRALCTEKLIAVRGGQAVAPNFNLFTQTPLPTHFWGLTINDLGLSWDKRSIQYGEAQGIPNVPMGIYDWSGNLVDSTTTDFNGFYEAIEPSTSSYNCPLPAGPCAGMYRFVGNDPGQPGQHNPNYNPRFRTISANFQAWPGLFTVTDTAPTMAGAVIVTPGTTSPQPVVCEVSPTTPEVFAVSTPYVSGSSRTVTVTGQGFGSYVAPNASGSKGSLVQLIGPSGNVASTPAGTAWTDRGLTFQVPGTLAAAPYQLRIRNGQSMSWTSSASTIHVLGTGYRPTLIHVGSGAGQTPTVQAAISSIPLTSQGQQSNTNYLILVHPGAASASNPDGAYRENLVVNRRVKIQGYGPGGTYSNGTHVPGSVIDGQAFDADGATGTAWFNLVAQPHTGPDGVADGATVTVLPRYATQFAAGGAQGYATLDGLRITGGYQQDVNANLNTITGANVTGFGAPGATVTQGGGIYVHASARNLRVTNDLITGNSGTFGGGIRIGTPYVGNNGNTGVRISYNRVRDNGGTNLAGGIGVFSGATGYSVDNNDICGNFSAEYGGAVSHFGLSANGVIDHNRMWFNETYDEGGAVMVAGELPANPDNLSTGSGPVTIRNNEIVANNANDDGGGVRLLQVNDARMDIVNNIIADNLSTHEGGGVALDDATNVRFLNNTVARNITTATAVTSDGNPAPAGLSTGHNSVQLQATLPSGRSVFSNPVLRNNVFWENMAGTWTGLTVTGIGLTGDSAVPNIWDLGTADGSGTLEPTRSVLTTPNAGQATVAGANVPGTNVPLTSTRTTSPYFDELTSGNGAIKFLNPYSVGVDVSTLRTFPGFRQSVIVVRNAAPDALGNYHLDSGSTAVGLGTARASYTLPWFTTPTNVDAPNTDIDGNTRYTGNPTTTTAVEAGADERP